MDGVLRKKGGKRMGRGRSPSPIRPGRSRSPIRRRFSSSYSSSRSASRSRSISSSRSRSREKHYRRIGRGPIPHRRFRRSPSFSPSRSPPRRSSSLSNSPRAPLRKRSESPSERTLHIKNLTRNVKEQHLKEIFGCFGEIKRVDIVWDKRINVPCDYAFIEFSSSTDSERALNCMNGSQLDGQYIKVENQRRHSPPPRPRKFSPPRRGIGRRPIYARKRPSPGRFRRSPRGWIGRHSSSPRKRSPSRSPRRRVSRSPRSRVSRSPRSSYSRSPSPKRAKRISRSPSRERRRVSSPKKSISPSRK